jgi:hypothetical protein
MKKNVLLIGMLIFVGFMLNAQSLTYKELNASDKKPKGKFIEYVAENGHVFKVGDMITIGVPLNQNNVFVHIKESDGFSTLSFPNITIKGFESEIKKFRVAGTKRQGFVITAICKTGFGLTNYYIQIEKAIRDGEIETSVLTRSQAIAKLKDAKDLLDLDMMTQEEYDIIKSELAPIIIAKKNK